VAVAAAILATALLNLGDKGVALVGVIPPGLPAFALPDLSLVPSLWTAALGIALMSFTESIAAARSFMKHDDTMPEPDQELFALGMANIGGGFFQAMPAGGGTSQTAVNAQAGAKTQLAGITTAAAVILTLLFLAPFISLMPEAALGALVLVAAAGLINVGEFQAIARIRKVEFWWAIIAFAGVVLLGTLEGILVAVIASLLNLIHQANHPPVHFASASRTGDALRALIIEAQPQVLVVDCSAIPDIEYTALEMLIVLEEKLREQGITLWLAALNPEPLKIVERSPFGATLGHERMFFNLEQAVAAYEIIKHTQQVKEPKA
jgi:MFS superfamily sulfate permease-like transporter